MNPREFNCAGLRVLVALIVIGAIVTLGGGVRPAAGIGPGVELSFDDGPDDTNDDSSPSYPLQNASTEGSTSNPFPSGGPQLQIKMDGIAKRTFFGDGKYGRGIELGGGDDAISVSNIYDSFNTPSLYAFWDLDNDQSGVFWEEEDRFKVELETGAQLSVTVYDESGVGQKTMSGLFWPSLTAWHHLQIHWGNYNTMGDHFFVLRIDWDTAVSVVTDALQPGPPTKVLFGKGIDGRVDELQAANQSPNVSTHFDFDEHYCGTRQTAVCEEHVATALAEDLDTVAWNLPVRYKILYDQGECTSLNKCRVVFAVSGGGPCPDDYPSASDGVLDEILAVDSSQPSGSELAVVVVDPICWIPGFSGYPDEATQFVAVKDHIAANHSDLLDLTEFYATGCSLGAGSVINWTVRDSIPEADRPKRTFARSASGIGAHVDCVYHETWCGVKQEGFDKGVFGEGGRAGCDLINPWEHPHLDPCVLDYLRHEDRDPFIELVNDNLVGHGAGQDAREIGLSWGANTEDEVCNVPTPPSQDPSGILCIEEGGFAATDAGRQFRDKWRQVEGDLQLDPKTGFFIENDSGDCIHCGLTPVQRQCLAKYLEGGRARLEATPEAACLAMGDNNDVPPKVCFGYPP